MKSKFLFITTLLFTTTILANENRVAYSLIQRNYEIDQNINPCDDFHQYICNKVEKEFKLPADRSRYAMAFSDAAESILNYKKDYLKNLANIDPKNDKEKAIKNYYLSCMDLEANSNEEVAYTQQLKLELDKIKTKEEMLNLLQSKYLGLENGLLRPTSINNQDDSTLADLAIIPTVLSLPEKSFYDKQDLEKDYIKLNTKLFTIIGENNPDKIASFLFNFEKEIASKFPTPLEIRTILSQKSFKLKEDLYKLTNLQLEKSLNSLPKNVLIRSVAYDSLVILNEKINSLTLEDLKYIYLYNNLKDIYDVSQSDYFNEKLEFNAKYLGGAPKRSERNEECTKAVMSTFPMELDYVLVDRIFPNFPKNNIKKLVADIRGQIIKTLKSNKWLSKQGKAGAIKKMQLAKLYLVSPENERQWNFKPQTEYDPKTAIANTLKVKNLILRKEYSEFGKKKPLDRWEYGPLTMNAYYNPTANHFVMLNAILQPPFYDIKNTYQQNLAGIGMIIGHELGHGIDDQGRRYDEKGSLRDWVTKNDIEGLKQRTLPLINQFNKIGHNGELTLGENIGDLVGLTNSFKVAFPNYKKGKYSKENLQIFFNQYARMWCEVQTDSTKELRLKTDPHALGFARINEQVRNQIGFQDAYECKEGNKLYQNEDKMVKIW